MSFIENNEEPSSGGGSGNADVVIQLQGIIQQLSALVGVFGGRFAFGTFTMSAAATTVIQNTGVSGNSAIVFIPTNAAAGTLMGSNKSLYISAISAGTSFTVATASGVAAAGTETFTYYAITPL